MRNILASNLTGWDMPPTPKAIIPIAAVLRSFKAFFSVTDGASVFPLTLTGWMSESDDYFCHKDQQANDQQKANIFEDDITSH